MHEQGYGQGPDQGGYTGPTAGIAGKPIDASGRLAAAQSRLHEAIDDLEQRLMPILGMDAPVSEVAVDSPDPSTLIHNAATTADMQAARIHRIIKRVEL